MILGYINNFKQESQQLDSTKDGTPCKVHIYKA